MKSKKGTSVNKVKERIQFYIELKIPWLKKINFS